jgi:hypothetical protein
MGKTTKSKIPEYVYRLRREDVSTLIGISRGDHNLLKVYKNMDRKPMIAVLHDLIGLGAKCREEKHVEEIKDLEERLRISTSIAVTYIRKFGKIRREET